MSTSSFPPSSKPTTPQAPEPPAQEVKPKDWKLMYQAKSSEFVDPCEEASRASMACLNRHDYNREKCLDFFQAYRDCKKAWMDKRKEERSAPGVKPGFS